MMWADVGGILILVGVLIVAVSAIGLLRLPDFYARLSGLTTAGGVAFVFIMLGLLLHFPSPSNALKVGLALFIQLATAAVGGNALARAGYLEGVPRTPATRFDDLATAEMLHDAEDELLHHADEEPGPPPYGGGRR